MGRKFQREFLDFVPVLTNKKSGDGQRIRYIYKGKLYRAAVSDRVYARTKAVYGVLTLCLWAVFLYAASCPTPGASSRLVALAIALSVFALGYLTVGVVLFLLSKRKLTSDSYTSIRNMLSYGSFFGTITFSFAFLAVLVFEIFMLRAFSLSDTACGFGYLLCAALLTYINYTWRKLDFTVLSTEAEEVSKAKDEFDDMIELHKHLFRKNRNDIDSDDFR